MSELSRPIDPENQTPTPAVRTEIDNDIVTLTIDVVGKSVNVLSQLVMEQLDNELNAIKQMKHCRGLIIRSGKERSFVAGADVTEIEALRELDKARSLVRQGQLIFQRIADFPFPTVAAINGVCLGGGFEMILACDVRIAADIPEVSIGLPEVMLGIVPGFGGTQRLPRLIGMAPGFGLILSGRRLNAAQAKRRGVVDAVVPIDNLQSACQAWIEAKKRPRRRPTQPLVMRLLESTALGRRTIAKKARAEVMKNTNGHYPAPLRAIELIERTIHQPIGKGLETEAYVCAELICNSISKNLIQVFFLTEGAKKGGSREAIARVANFDKVGVMGSGIMGQGIAQLLASRNMQVRLRDLSIETLSKAMAAIAKQLQRRVRRRRLTKKEADQHMWRIRPTTHFDGLRSCQVVIEAIVEDAGIKQELFREIEAVTDSSTLLATNTSSLSVTTIAEGLAHPERVVGMHFFNPVYRMPLVEIIAGEKSDPQAVQDIYALALRLKKNPVLVKDRPGFLVNRLLGFYMHEATQLYMEGHTLDDIDRALVEFGMPMGPFELMDIVGIDIAKHVEHNLIDGLERKELRKSELFQLMVNEEWHGQKNGIGFYLYRGGSKKGVNSKLSTLPMRMERPNRPERADEASRRERWQRPIFTMINEACRCLDEGVVANEDALDLAMITGTGFPPFRGGLMRYARSLERKQFQEHWNDYAQRCAERFVASRTLERIFNL